jgi:hypothetical protein
VQANIDTFQYILNSQNSKHIFVIRNSLRKFLYSIGEEPSPELMDEAMVTMLFILLGETEITPKMKEKLSLAFGSLKPAQMVKALEVKISTINIIINFIFIVKYVIEFSLYLLPFFYVFYY